MTDISLNALRGHLFDVIERLKDSNDPTADKKDIIDIDTANAINRTAQTIINAAKIEIEAFKLIGQEGEITGLKSSGILMLGEKKS